MSAHSHAHDAHEATTDPVEAVTSQIPWVIPLAGAILIFLLAAIAVLVA